MKLIILMIALSFSAFSQVDDGYHAEPIESCQSGDCIYVDGLIYEMITHQDIEGYEFSRLNKKSDIESVFHGEVDACFSGDAKKSVQALQAMRGVNNYYYIDGGHIEVISLNIKTQTESKINFSFSYITDYTGEEVFTRSYSLNKCL